MTRYIKFVVSRLFGTLVDTIILWLLSNYIFSSYVGVYIISPAISFEVAMFSNFCFSYFWIWNMRLENKGTKTFFIRLLYFNLSSIGGFGIKMGCLLLFERLFHLDVVYCNLLALLISGLANYFLADLMVFRKSPYMKKIKDHILTDNVQADIINEEKLTEE